jgi:hypothetical protein
MKIPQFCKSPIASNPLFYQLFINLFRPRKKTLLIRDSTELVIDGFPRSANTFAVVAFELSQVNKVHIAHHTHAPATIIEGCKRKIPTLLLIRSPLDCVISASIFLNIPPIPLLKEWIWFYQKCLPFKENIIIARFEDVTTQYDKVINELNERFNTNFSLFNNDEKSLSYVNQYVENIAKRLGQSELQVARPSCYRTNLAEIKKATIYENTKLYSKAQLLYDKLLTQQLIH